MPTRRQALLGLAAVGITATMAGCRGTASEAPTGVRRIDGSLTSRHVRGSSSYAVATPEKDAPTGLVIALHGYGSNGPHMMELLGLADHVKRTGLAIAAISGGNYYWHARRAVSTGKNQHPALDPGAMVLIDANRAFADKLPHAVTNFDAGGHTGDYWHAHAGRQLDWLASLARQ